MEPVAIAYAFAAQSQAQTGQALQAELMKMAANADANVVALLQSGAESLQATRSAPPAGMGASLDISV